MLFYLAIRAVHDVVVPWFHFAAVVMIKRVVVGKFKPGPRPQSGWGAFRHWIMAIKSSILRLRGLAFWRQQS